MLVMMTIVHVLIALTLIFLVLIQDSKGGMGALSGGGSNSVLGAAGAESLLAKLTRWVAVFFAASCIALTLYSTRQRASVVDDFVAPVPAQTAPAVPVNAEPVNNEATPPDVAPAE